MRQSKYFKKPAQAKYKLFERKQTMFTRKNLTFGLLALVAIAALFAIAGHPLVDPAVLAGLGMIPVVTGETSFGEIKQILEAQGRDFEQHTKAQNDRMDELELKFNRQGLGALGGSGFGEKGIELKALNGAVRALLAGQQSKADDLFIEAKAMSVGSDPDGGYVVHPVISAGMTKVMAEISPVYRLARKIPMTTGDAFEEPIDRDSAEANWVAETETRNDTGTPQLGNFRVPLHEVCAMPSATQKLVDVAGIDVLAWLQQKVGDAFAVKESSAFHGGNSVGKPMGIMAYPVAATADATRPWGTIQFVPSGAADAVTFDALEDLVGSLKAQYRNGAVWLMNRKTASAIRKIKSTDGVSLWQSSMQLGQPDVLLGYEVAIDEDMPDIAANSLPICFGNIAKGYTIAEMPGAKFLTDPYTAKPNVRLYAYRRVGGAVNNSEAIKLLKVSV